MRAILISLISFWLAMGVVAHAQNYTVEPGDVLEVSIYQDPKLNRQIVVAPDGQVAFPLAGRFQAGGLTLGGVEAALKSRLQKQFATELDVTVSYVQSPKQAKESSEANESESTIFVTGEVNKPGSYTFPEESPTLLQVIALSGGLGPFAAQRRITVHRQVNGQEMMYEFDYKSFVKGSDAAGNITLRDGDVVVVPERGLFE
jgi:polysaccharide biosynthesis/export protein